jgi:hypothetical protein
MNYKKILVVSPSNLITGGPEALHNLVHELRKLNLPAHICYYPYEHNHLIPAEYQKFDVAPVLYDDSPGNLIIFPETFTHQLSKVLWASTAIWWLSLDNFLVRNQRVNDTKIRSYFRYLRLALKGSRPLWGVSSLKKSFHYSQSRYVEKYLSRKGIHSQPLFEPINDVFLRDDFFISSDFEREPCILYNPAKGLNYTKMLINACSGYKFIPLKGLTRDELRNRMIKSKVYIDFGHHPGRDRMPREAAMLGMVVITSTKGSAGIFDDVPLPEKFKLDVDSKDFVCKFKSLLSQIEKDFKGTSAELDLYRNHLRSEPEIFKKCIKEIFLK